MKTDYLPFTEAMLPESGRLLAARHARDRRALPLLPPRFEDPANAEKAVRHRWSQKLVTGYAAFRGGAMAGYVLGTLVVQPWARSVERIRRRKHRLTKIFRPMFPNG